jgi:hypothetical protein
MRLGSTEAEHHEASTGEVAGITAPLRMIDASPLGK